MPIKYIHKRLVILLACTVLLGSSALAQNESVFPKYPDTIILGNKDRIIGEIKKMENGVATVKTDYSDKDFNVKWVNITGLSSPRTYLLILSNGNRYNSKLIFNPSSGKVTLHQDFNDIVVNIEDIVYLKPVNKKFISRFTASVSVGFNFTKSNNLKQLNIRSNLDYTSNFWTFSGSYNSVLSEQDDTEDVKRTDGNLGVRYFFQNDYFLAVSSEFLSNTEQKLDLRVATKLGGGKYFFHNNRSYFGGGLGLVWNNERFSDVNNTSQNSVELFGSLELNLFDLKDFHMLTNLTLYPSLTEKGRLRSDFSIDLKYDLPLDFFIKLGGTYNYDNKPIEGASKDDYVVQATFGWEFN